MQEEAQKCQIQGMKMKLQDFHTRIVKMSAVQFDKICMGRIEKQNEEVCIKMVKVLFEGAKIGHACSQARADELNQSEVENFKKFEQLLL